MKLEANIQEAAKLTSTLAIPDEEQTFNWRHCWYPVSFVQDLPPNRPYSFSLYDEPFVLFRNQEEKLVCLIDRCSHRAAKLSDGQIIDGKLECLYHGWQFGSEGQCLHIPQLAADVKIPVNACVQSFTVVERQGVIWVWPGEPETADIDRIPTADILNDPEFVSTDYMGDLPYDQTYLVENFLDPAHVYISHDRTEAGIYRENAQPLEMEVIENSAKGMRGRYRGTSKPDQPWQQLDFIAPNFVHYRFSFGKPGWSSGLALYAIPLGQGRSRVFVRRYRNFLTQKVKQKPRWVEHLRQSKVLEEDLPQIVGQQAEIERLGQSLKKVYLPLKTSDLLAIEYRKWLDKYGQSLPFYEGYATSKRPTGSGECNQKPASVDRLSRHTLMCSSCNRAYQVTNRLKQGSLIVAIAIAALAIVIDEPGSLKLVTVLAFLAAVAISAVAQTVKTKFERSYERR